MSRFAPRLATAAVTAVLLGLPVGAHATTVTYSNFSSTAGLTLVGNAATAVTGDGTVLRVTPADYWQSGAAYSTTPVTLGSSDIFSTQFQFRFTGAGGIDPADGITFVLAANPTGLGASGFGIGYYGVPNSVAIEFDTYDNGEAGHSNHVALDTDGNFDGVGVSPYSTSYCNFDSSTSHLNDGCMSNGDLWTANIGYDGTNLTVRLKQDGFSQQLLIDAPIDVSAFLGTNQAYVGFTSGTGAGYENHDILNWSFADTTALSTSAPEPGTWALTIVGLGMLGAGMRARRSARRALT
jgi:hypothetical protein